MENNGSPQRTRRKVQQRHNDAHNERMNGLERRLMHKGKQQSRQKQCLQIEFYAGTRKRIAHKAAVHRFLAQSRHNGNQQNGKHKHAEIVNIRHRCGIA